jgi:hypothetical protein
MKVSEKLEEKMKINTLWVFNFVFIVLISGAFFQIAGAMVLQDSGNTYLIDRTGERWDITQARSMGFSPHGFEFGIGRNAFQPLTDQDWHPDIEGHRSKMPIIGISGEGDSHAYAIEKLRYHETANTMLGSKPIVAGY